MKKLNSQLIITATLPLFLFCLFVLWSELRTEGTFGGIMAGFKILFFLLLGVGLFIATLLKNLGRIRKGNEVREARIILSILTLATIISISSFWFPYDFFDPEPELMASDEYGNKLSLFEEGFVLLNREIEVNTVTRGHYQIKTDTLFLIPKGAQKVIESYLMTSTALIPIYSSQLEQDSTHFFYIRQSSFNYPLK